MNSIEKPLLAVAILVAAFLFGWMMAIAQSTNVSGPFGLDMVFDTQSNEITYYIRHIVQPGETLWGIAKRYRPDEDPRRVVAEIQEASNVEGELIYPYQLILVPIREG